MCGLVRCTEVRNVAKHPVLNENDNNTTYNCGNRLCHEHYTGCDLHIMPKFQVANVRESLAHGNVRVSLKDHHRSRTAGECITDNKFCENLKGESLVRNGLDHANRDDEYEGDKQCEKKSPNWKLCIEDFDCDDGQNEGDDEEHQIPVMGYLRIN